MRNFWDNAESVSIYVAFIVLFAFIINMMYMEENRRSYCEGLGGVVVNMRGQSACWLDGNFIKIE